jgi:hypothetical protein
MAGIRRPTCGYRRLWVLLNRLRREQGLPALNAKRVYRLAKAHKLLLQRYTGMPPMPAHEGTVAVPHTDRRPRPSRRQSHHKILSTSYLPTCIDMDDAVMAKACDIRRFALEANSEFRIDAACTLDALHSHYPRRCEATVLGFEDLCQPSLTYPSPDNRPRNSEFLRHRRRTRSICRSGRLLTPTQFSMIAWAI